MEILKTALEWAKDELFSAWIFILFGILFVVAAAGFWQLGKTDLSKAFIFPMLISGSLLLVAGLGFYSSNKSRLTSFEVDYKKDAVAFVQAEIERVEKTMGEYETIAFNVFPIVMAVAALLIVFIDAPMWRAISITILALLLFIVLIDSNAHARLKTYHKQLKQEQTI